MSYIGRSVRALGWEALTSGRSIYTGDLYPEGLLTGLILRSPHPFARVEAIDTRAAAAMPGVHAAVTAADLPPGLRYLHEGAADRPPLADGWVRFVGQEVAAVAALTRAQASAALAAIEVRYAVLPGPLTPARALLPGSARLHDRKSEATSSRGNISRRFERRWGDFDAGLSESSDSVHGGFSYQRVAHACMEPQTTLAEWNADEGRMHLWTSTQAPYFIVREVTHALGLAEGQVVCHEVAVGGGFGAKSKIGEHEVITALLARASGRPVRVSLSREEEFAFTKSRHAFSMRLGLHADREGRIRGIGGDVVVDNGAYDHSGVSVMSAGVKAFGMMYRPQGIAVDAALVDTATVPGGQFRGYGSTQTGFAMESLVDELAGRLHIDPVELRLRNANQPGDKTLMGAQLGSVRLDECLRAASEAIQWAEEKARRRPGRGVGIAATVHPSGAYAHPGANRSDAAIDVYADGRVRVRFGGADTGTGQRTILAQIAAQELGTPLDKVEVMMMDTEKTPRDMGAWSSRGTHYGGHAVRMAARLAAERMPCFASEAVEGVLTTQASYEEQRVERPDPATGSGNYSASYNFAAHAALVDVDRRTGQVRVLDYVAAHDIGTAINPVFAKGQIVGGVAMGMGGALSEELIFEQGRVVNPAYLHYALPRAADLPRIRAIIVDGHDQNGPYGAKGVGETGVNPPGAAIANAVWDAIGIRVRDLPITPDKIINALAQAEGRRRRHHLWRRPGRWWIQCVRWTYGIGLLQWLHRRVGPLPTHAFLASPAEVEMPDTVTAALRSLDRDAMVIAGGTDVEVQRRQGLARPKRLISIIDIARLRQIEPSADGGLTLGAAVTLADAVGAVRQRVPLLADAIDTVATPQIRAMATIGGNLLQAKRCWFYRNDFPCFKRLGGLAPCYAIRGDHRFHHAVIDGHRCQAVTPSDLATALVALDARALVSGPGGEERVVTLDRFYTGPGETVVGKDELLIGIQLPNSTPGVRRVAGFEKLRLSEGDFAIVSAAISARVDTDGVWHDTRVVLGALAPIPLRAFAIERALDGSRPAVPAVRAAAHAALNRELDRRAHPLERNGWKLDAASGVVEKLLDRLTEVS